MPHARRPTYHLLEKLPEFHEMGKAAGRTLPITAFGAEHDPAMWLAYRDAGIERIVLSLDSAAADVILPKLDALGGQHRHRCVMPAGWPSTGPAEASSPCAWGASRCGRRRGRLRPGPARPASALQRIMKPVRLRRR